MATAEKGKRERCGISNFQVFRPPLIFDDVLDSKVHVVPVSSGLPILIGRELVALRFNIPASDSKWISPAFHLSMTCKLQTGTGANVAPAANASVISGILNNLFQKVQVSLNQCDLYELNDYGYVNHLSTVLFTNEAQQRIADACEMQFLDKTLINDVGANTAWNARIQQMSNGLIVELYGPLRVPLLWTASRFIPNGISVDLTLFSYSPRFFVHAETPQPNDTYRLQIDSLNLHYVAFEMRENFLRKHQSLFDKQMASIPFSDFRVLTHLFRAGARDLQTSQFLIPAHPRRVFCGMVREDNFLGSYSSSPLEFSLINAKSCRLKLDDSTTQIDLNAADSQFASALYTLYETIGLTHGDMGVSYIDNSRNSSYPFTCLFGFDCTRSRTGACADFNDTRSGSCVLSVQFTLSAALQSNYCLIIFYEVDHVLLCAPYKIPVIQPASGEYEDK